jgi:hypothetical protein
MNYWRRIKLNIISMNNKLLLVNCLFGVLLSFGYFRNFLFVAEINCAGVGLWGRDG